MLVAPECQPAGGPLFTSFPAAADLGRLRLHDSLRRAMYGTVRIC